MGRVEKWLTWKSRRTVWSEGTQGWCRWRDVHVQHLLLIHPSSSRGWILESLLRVTHVSWHWFMGQILESESVRLRIGKEGERERWKMKKLERGRKTANHYYKSCKDGGRVKGYHYVIKSLAKGVKEEVRRKLERKLKREESWREKDGRKTCKKRVGDKMKGRLESEKGQQSASHLNLETLEGPKRKGVFLRLITRLYTRSSPLFPSFHDRCFFRVCFFDLSITFAPTLHTNIHAPYRRLKTFHLSLWNRRDSSSPSISLSVRLNRRDSPIRFANEGSSLMNGEEFFFSDTLNANEWLMKGFPSRRIEGQETRIFKHKKPHELTMFLTWWWKLGGVGADVDGYSLNLGTRTGGRTVRNVKSSVIDHERATSGSGVE